MGQKAARTTAQVLQTGQGLKRGSKRFGEAVLAYETSMLIGFSVAQLVGIVTVRPDIVWIPLTDVDPLRVALAWPEDGDNPLARAFAQVVREVRKELAAAS